MLRLERLVDSILSFVHLRLVSPGARSALTAIGIVVALLWMAAPPSACAQRFYPDDPIWDDPDRMDMPVPVSTGRRESLDPFHLIARTIRLPGDHDGPAVNVNTLGGVPNSSWYTNRHYRDRLSLDELRRGPNTGPPPDASGPWTVTRVRRLDGLAHLDVTDAAGRAYELVFDARDHASLATGAARVSACILHAMGYNVPEHHSVQVPPDRLRPASSDSSVTRDAVWAALNGSAVSADGTYRAVARRIPEAEARIGPFQFYGTRPDDGNDVFPHEARRELRGLRVIAAWIHHTDIRSAYTEDVVVEAGGRTFVRHYLTRLWTTLGSGGKHPKALWAGHEEMVDVESVLTRVGTLGLSGGEWMEATAPDWPGVGLFEAEHFDPHTWTPEVPNPAFARMRPADAFWAAKQVAHIRPDELRAMVDAAAYPHDSTAAYVTQVLKRRQDALTQAYVGWAGGLDRFRVEGGLLAYDDLRHRHGLVQVRPTRTVTWHRFDNARNRVTRRLAQDTTSATALPIPDDEAPYLRARFQTPGHGTVTVYLRRTASGWTVVGLERRGGTAGSEG